MDKKQLLEIIEKGESEEVEFKRSFNSTQEAAKIMTAFANTKGGILFYGVDDNKTLIGVKENTDSIQQNISSAAQTIAPPIVPEIKIYDIEAKKIIAVIVQRAIDNTFHTSQGVIYAKIGSTTKKIEGNNMVDFLRAKQILCFDETYNDANIRDISIEKVKGYLARRKQQDYLQTHTVEDLLLSLGVAVRKDNLLLKNAATLFFAADVMRFHRQMEVKLAQFEGIEQVKVIAHELVQADPVEAIDRSLAFVKNHLTKSFTIDVKGVREERYEYPFDVVREAVVNAIAHRDYFSKDAVQIYMFADRIEITSPGSLPKDLPRELFGAISSQRNPLTYRILRDVGYVEGLGSGVPRMINGMREYRLQDPEFQIYDRFFRVLLRSKTSARKPIKERKDLNERQQKALTFLKKYTSLKTKQYMDMNHVSFGTANKEINELLQFGHIKKVGQYRNVYYVLS